MRLRAIYFLFTILLSFYSLKGVYSQNSKPVKLYGLVTDVKSSEGLPYVTIAVKHTGKGTSSRATGYFDLEVPSDTSTIVVSCVGYETQVIKLSPERIRQKIEIGLQKGYVEIESVTVSAEKERIIRVSDNISAVKMSPKLIAKLPNLGEVDIMRSFQLLPGVSATNETSAGLFVRGGTPDQNLILFDGMTIYHVDHFYGFFSAFNANTIDDIELMKGGFPAKYGGRTSSVMEITGKPADLEKAHGGGSVSLLSGNGYLELPLIKKKLSWQIAARRSYSDIVQTSLYNNIFNLYEDESSSSMGGGFGGRRMQETFQPSYYFYDINSKLTYKPDENNIFSLSLYNGEDNLDKSREIPVRNFGSTTTSGGETVDLTNWGNLGASVQWQHAWNETFNSRLFLSYSDYFSTRDARTNTDDAQSSRMGMNTFEDNNVEDISLRFRNELQLAENNTLEFGLEHTYNDISYYLNMSDTVLMIDEHDYGNQTAAYIQDKFNIGKSLEINLGGRSTYYDVTGKFYFDPRLSLSMNLSENLKLKSSWGKYHQFNSRIIREDILQGSKDFWLMADDVRTPISSSTHYITGFSYEKNGYLLDIEGYYKKMSGLSEYTMRFTRTQPPRGQMVATPDKSRDEYFFKGDGYAKGIDFLIQKKSGYNTGWLGYTLSEVKHTFSDLNNGNPYYALHDQTHEFKAIYSFQYKGFNLSSAFIYATGKPYTSPISQYELTLLDGSVYNYIHVSEKNSFRLPDYHRLDISGSYTWGKRFKNTLALSVFNLYNRSNVWYKEFEIYGNTLFETDITLLGITPNISYTIKF